VKDSRTPACPRLFLLERTDKFLRERSGVIKGKDIEYLHRMRVASRRLRTALWVFKSYLLDPAYRRLTGMVKEVTGGLGRARDLDTHIAFLKELSGQVHLDSDFYPGIRALSDDLCAQRQGLQDTIRLLLNKLDSRKMKDEIGMALKGLPEGHKDDRIGLKRLSRKKISRRLEDFLRAVPGHFSLKMARELHALRIEAKHLRYALENFNPVYEGRLDKYIDAAHGIQDHLGDFHNYHVWLLLTRKFARHHGHNEKLACGIRYVEEECIRRRDEAFRSFIRLWEDLSRKRRWEKLKKLL
jgi:CHAD domain-containing protein